MELTPYVRYRAAGRRVVDRPHEPDDFRVYHDQQGRLWWRVAVTHGVYASAAEARTELDFIEQQEEANDLAA